jgi:uncharacterized protein
MKIAGFEWDEGNWPKCGKHGASKNEIEGMLLDQPSTYLDPDHSAEEQRYRAIGVAPSGRFLLVAFTLRGEEPDTRLRPISARYMHLKEVRRYGH